MALANLGDLALELRAAEEALFQEQIAHRLGGALEIVQPVIALAEVFGGAAQLIEAHQLAAGKRAAQRVRLLLPELHAVVDGVDRAGVLAAHVGRVFGHCFFGAGWMLSTQCTSSGISTTGMSRFTTTGSWPLLHSTHESGSVSLALISWCGT